jgi:paraquat-inducible protein B
VTDTPPNVPIQPARRSLLERLSIVWLIPLAALIIALGVAVQSYLDRGPLVQITFENASGVVAGQTELRYRDVAVGLVEKIGFTENLDHVQVSVRLDKAVRDFVDDGAAFFVVRPEISARGVSGLETVLSGVYIQAAWDDQPGGFQSQHEGSDEPPLMAGMDGGLKLRLKAAPDAGLTENAPIIYQGVEVGRIGRAEITEDGQTVEADAVIYAPHARLVTTATRFWDASGFRFSLGPGGARLDFSSVASLVSGGVTFRTVVSGGRPAQSGDNYLVYADEGAARGSVFSEEEGPALDLTAIFEDNVSGLAVDAPVDLGGVRIGRVTAVNGLVDPARFGDNRVRLAATLAINPARLGLEGEAGPKEAQDFLARRVTEGLRVRLVSASLLSNGLKVEMITVDDPADPDAILDPTGEPNPTVPTTDSDIADVSATAEGVFERINNLPIEELLQSAIGLMDNISRVAGSPDLRALPGDLRGAVGEVRGIIGSEEIQALPARIGSVADQLDQLVTALNEQDTATRVLAAVDAARDAAQGVAQATEGLPELLARLDTLAAKANDLPLEELTSEITGLAQNARRLVSSDALQALPAAATATLAEVDAILTDARNKGLTDSMVAALDAARDAAGSVTASVEGVPDLIDRLNAVAAKAETVPLDQLSTDLSALMQSANAVLDTPGARELPEDLGQALTELTAVLKEMREGGVVENVNATFSSARQAADTLREVASQLPALLDRARATIAQAGTTIQGYDADRGVGRDISTALREVERAANAVNSLARALERNPNSLLFGR